MAAGATYTPIASFTVSTAQASYTFTSVSGAFTDLVLIVNGQTSVNDREIRMQVGNGSADTGSNYSWTNILGYSGGAISQRGSSVAYCQISASSSNTVPGTYIAHLMNYANTTTYKTVLSRGNNVGTTSVTDSHVSLWRSTVAINTVKVFPTTSGTPDFSVGTTLALYGITAA